MGFLGAGAESRKSTEVRVGFRRGWFRYVEVALGGAGMVAVLLAGMKLMETQPGQAFHVLSAWGPWPFVVLVGLGFGGNFVSRLNDTIQSTFAGVVESSQQSAQAHGRTADALQELAKQGSRQAEEVRRLAIYAGRELGSMAERMDRQDEVLQKVATGVEKLQARAESKNGADGR